MAKGKFDGLGLVLPIAGEIVRFPQYRWFTKDEYLERKAELQNKPSWKDAPSWASHLAQSDSGTWHWMDGEPEINEIHDSGEFWSDPGYSVVDDNPRGEVLGDWRDTLEQRPADLSESVVTERPEESTWFERGELPPVGTRCEAISEPDMDWLEVEVIAHRDGFAIVWCGDEKCGANCDDPKHFRPIRTEREKEIEEMMSSVLAVMNRGLQRRLCEDLYDAGYRKQEVV